MSVLMSEHAAAAVVAHLLLIEGSAVLSSSFAIHSDSCPGLCEFIMSMGKLALFAISAMCAFDPVFAHLGLIQLG